MAKYQLTWLTEKSTGRKRWRKKYKGKVYVWNLRKGETKAESYRRCLKEWEKKKAEIDGNVQAAEPWHVALVRLISRVKAKMAELELKDAELEKKPDEQAENRRRWSFCYAQLRSYEWCLENGVDLMVDPAKPVDFLPMQLPGEEPDNTPPWDIVAQSKVVRQESIEANVKAFLDFKAAQVERGELSAGRYEKIRIGLESFTNHVGKTKSIKSVTTLALTQFRDVLQARVSKGMSDYSARDELQAAKQFTRWAYENELIELPRIIGSRQFTISVTPKQVDVFTDSEVLTLLKGASEQTRLYILLMLNCGMQQKDISDLQQSEVDWSTGYLTRKRSKTKSHDKVPTVSYKLWPETFKLLKKHRSKHKTLVLTNANGSSLKREAIVNGKMKTVDNIKSAWNRLAKKAKINKPPKLLRKTAASKLGSHPEYGRYTQHFLGHAPATMADKHYVKPTQEQFDAAVTWLGVGNYLNY